MDPWTDGIRAAADASPGQRDLMLRRRFILAFSMSAAIAAAGLYLALLVSGHEIGQPGPGRLNVFYVLFGRNEIPFQALQLGFLLAAILVVFLDPPSRIPRLTLVHFRPVHVAALVFGITLAGGHVAHHGLPLSMDEFNSEFQSQILAGGKLTAEVPDEVVPVVAQVQPTFVTFRSKEQDWFSSYLPAYSGLRALLVPAGLTALLNPLLAALAILAIASLARQLWPGSAAAAGMSMMLLASSAQFLATSMSGYSMPAHLLLNLVWMLLYLRAWPTAQLAAPWVGVLAMGLHNPFPHALFVAPFLVRMLRQREWLRAAYYSVVYAVGSLLWWQWLRIALSIDVAAAAESFAAPGALQAGTQLMSWAMLQSWQTPLACAAVLAAILGWRTLSGLQRDLAAGVGLSLLFYALLPFSQGHGWGYRYAYAVLGNVILLAVTGLMHCRSQAMRARILALTAASIAVSVTIELPLRAWQIERFVRPWAAAQRYLAELPVATVAVPTDSIWYGRDLVRNSPFLSTEPLILALPRPRDAQALSQLERLGNTGVLQVGSCDLVRYGLVGYPGTCGVPDEGRTGRVHVW